MEPKINISDSRLFSKTSASLSLFSRGFWTSFISSYSALILVLLLGAAVGSPGEVVAFFDTSRCRSDCSFRYNIQRDISGVVMLPFDSVRRIGYQKCLEECNKQAFPSNKEQEQ
jgi:hypothetical protein